MSILLIIVVVLLAVAGGFFGELLELAGWLILILVLSGAFLGGAAYFLARRVWKRLRSQVSG